MQAPLFDVDLLDYLFNPDHLSTRAEAGMAWDLPIYQYLWMALGSLYTYPVNSVLVVLLAKIDWV